MSEALAGVSISIVALIFNNLTILSELIYCFSGSTSLLPTIFL
nr:MAG TPA: hypothetical protein [Crassvirales sp.]